MPTLPDVERFRAGAEAGADACGTVADLRPVRVEPSVDGLRVDTSTPSTESARGAVGWARTTVTVGPSVIVWRRAGLVGELGQFHSFRSANAAGTVPA
jgi:hypothetical protein